ncbi:MAG: DUF86 domain-containing protein [Candidatus Lokiarchaeota archaeon]|nr:DUF86 domain-containing protein [Candidatus Lokiarchaeota archaeon]
MPKKRNIKLFLNDILEAISNILEYTKDIDDKQFSSDKKTRDAVLRNLEIIGEATKSIPDTFKKEYKDINWRGISGMRDKLIHEYFGVSNQIVWETIKNDIPTLKSQVEVIIKNLD